ncbi:Transposable element Tcb1 transposase, partial [Stegodyphus mimosarum]
MRTGIWQLLPKETGSRQLSSATGMTISRQTVYRRLGQIGLYAHRPVRCVPLTATHCRLRLAWSREHALWTPQQWACVMFSDESRFSLQSDSRRTFIWRAPGTRYHQENIIEQHRYGGAGVLVWGGIILGSRTDLHVQIGTMTSQIYRDVILEQHVLSGSKVLPGLESVMSVMGPLALAAMVSLPFVAPAAAALLPLASMTSVFGRRRRYLDGLRQNPLPDSEVLMRRIHAAAIRRNAY